MLDTAPRTTHKQGHAASKLGGRGYHSESGLPAVLRYDIVGPEDRRGDAIPGQRTCYLTRLSFPWLRLQPACHPLSSWKIRDIRAGRAKLPSLQGGMVWTRGLDRVIDIMKHDPANAGSAGPKAPRRAVVHAPSAARPAAGIPGRGLRRRRLHSSRGAVPDKGTAAAGDDRRVLERGTRRAR
jgi:hypothetical protein